MFAISEAVANDSSSKPIRVLPNTHLSIYSANPDSYMTHPSGTFAACPWFCDKQSCNQCHPNDVGYTHLASVVKAGLGL